MTSSRPARRFDWRNLALRAASAAVLIPAVVAAIFLPWLFPTWLSGVFPMLVAVSIALLSIEWAEMTAPRAPARVAVALTVAVVAPLLLAYRHAFAAADIAALIGLAVAAAAAWSGSQKPQDAAFGAVYMVVPCLALMWIRGQPNPISWTILLFAVTWSADIFAYGAGNLFKGPKLWPRYSPNKTWSGFVGGLIGAMAAAVLVGYFSTARLSFAVAAIIGLVGGLATMAGDLWESMLKRRYGVKDSGDIIPGHGGLLDRVDGLMFAILAIAAARYIHQSGWVR
jgi:phosphatidate cytidylyltransferase